MSRQNELHDVDIRVAVNRPTRCGRITAEHIAAILAEDSTEEEDPFVDGDDDDGDYVLDNVAGDASDIEVELEVEEAENDNGDGDDEDDEMNVLLQEELDAVSGAVLVPQQLRGEFYSCKDGIMWMKASPPIGRPQAHNVPVAAKAGPIGNFVQNPISIFKQFMTPEMLDIICRETNRKANEIVRMWNEKHATADRKVWQPTNENELYAFIGLLLFSGLFNSNTQPTKELWAPYHHDIYTATMSLKRFNILLRYIRFDNGNTREQRLLTSKSAAIDDIWIMLNANLERAYTPSANITVDEQLFPYRGHTRFTQYIPSKPAKYGIKVWWACDSRTNYPLKGKIYTGKLPNAEREVNQGERVVLSLIQRYHNSGRTIYCDNFFTSLSLAEHLLQVGLAIVGTVRSNKRFVPADLKKSRNRTLYQTLFGFYNEKYALCSYVPKPNKAVIVLSTEHYTCAIDEENSSLKPNQILDYNANKAGVDTMDQMISGYSCKRGTNRWPLAMFYNILDIAGLASFIVHNHLQPAKQSDKRRKFLTQLAIQLVTPHMEVRAMNGYVSRQPPIKRAMEKFGVIAPIAAAPAQVASSTMSVFAASASTGAGQPKKERKDCVDCRAEGEPRRKTFHKCFFCHEFMCLTHGKIETRASCNGCIANN